jgi:NAD(P)-dependent dehydrogenase (short-subunit alcohol dehydrogenase family)
MADLSSKNIVITGGNAGIGLAAAKALAALGARLLITGRNAKKLEVAVGAIREAAGHARVESVLGDHASLADVQAMGGEILERLPKIDVAIYNAGAMFAKRSLTVDGFERTFAINHLAHFFLHQILEDRLIQSEPSRVVVVASAGHRWGHGLLQDPQSEKFFSGMVAYGRSKLANILFARHLAKRLGGQGVTVNALHPGVIRSDLGRDGERGWVFNLGFSLIAPFVKDVEAGAATTVHLASSSQVEGMTGGYFRNSAPAQPWRFARDDDAAQRLWAMSESMIRVWRSKRAGEGR